MKIILTLLIVLFSLTVSAQIDNFYNVVVTNVREEVNDTDQNTTESIALVTLLEV